jgi:stearoyl-CoA desaturase (Delta-9 desaturase)
MIGADPPIDRFSEPLEGVPRVDLNPIFAWLQQGVTNAPFWVIVVYTLVVTHVTVVSVTLYLHRHSAHRSLELHPALRHVFRFWIWLTSGMVTKEWTAVHRKHHAFCETESDPHSPQIHGLRKVLLQGAELYRQGADAETLKKYGRGTPDDWVERNLYSRFAIGGVALMLVVDLALFGVIGLSVWAVQMLWMPLLAAGVVNGVGHYWGYRNFECPDAARNILPFGFFIGGEELHNNHHTYPNSAKFSVMPWEFDLGWLWIRMLRTVGLARPLSTGPLAARDPKRHIIDRDTVWAVFNDRFRVMAMYAERVVAPLAEQEYHRADKATQRIYKRAKSLLCREASLVDDRQQAQISTLIDTSPLLRTIYEMRQQLQQVCTRRSGDTEELLRAFKQWCMDAEATGIQALKDFVADLKSYTMPTMARA